MVCLQEAEANFDLDTFLTVSRVDLIFPMPNFVVSNEKQLTMAFFGILLATLHMSVRNMPFCSFHLFQKHQRFVQQSGQRSLLISLFGEWGVKKSVSGEGDMEEE